jgi:hypothetical protein
VRQKEQERRVRSSSLPHHFEGYCLLVSPLHIARHDVKLRQLQKDTEVESLLGELHMAFAGGADFE